MSRGVRASRRARFCALALAFATASLPLGPAFGQEQEDRFLTLEQAPGAVFPEAQAFERRDVPVSRALREDVSRRLGDARVSIWEDVWITFVARSGESILGYAVVLEEIGKHRPITSIVGVRPDGKVHDVAVMVYREAYGGEVKQRRFLDQYPGIGSDVALARRIRNVAGATLSVEALNRTVKKGLAVTDALYLHPGRSPEPTATATP